MKKALLAIIVSLLVAVGTSPAVAQGLGRSLPMLKERLGLSDQQVAEIRELLRKHRDAVFPLQQDLRAKRHALVTALEAPQPDPMTVGRLVIEQRALRQRIQKLAQQLQADVRAVLTPEQQQKFDQWRQSRTERLGARPLRQQAIRGWRLSGRRPGL